jgi:PAS domain-containing protein
MFIVTSLFISIMHDYSFALTILFSLKFITIGLIIYRTAKRQQATKQIIEKLSLYRMTFDHSHVPMALLDAKKNILDANREFGFLTGFMYQEDLLSKSFLDFLPTHLHQSFLKPIQVQQEFVFPIKNALDNYKEHRIVISCVGNKYHLVSIIPYKKEVSEQKTQACL